jgi:hypothetical protein
LSIVADVERPITASGPSLLRLLMAAIAVVLLVYVAALLVVIEFVYRHLIAAPIAWLLIRLGSTGSPAHHGRWHGNGTG